jgi:hypothetical protein
MIINVGSELSLDRLSHRRKAGNRASVARHLYRFASFDSRVMTRLRCC